MVNWLFFLSSFAVPLIVNSLITLIILGFVYKKRIEPLIESATEVFENADKAISKGMSALGKKSGQVRIDKNIEKAVASDILNSKMPEVKALLELVSPSTLEMFEDNPDGLLRLAQKYGHYFGLNIDGSSSNQEQAKETDF